MSDDAEAILEKLRRLDNSDPEFLAELRHILKDARSTKSSTWSRLSDRSQLIDYLDGVRLLHSTLFAPY